MNKENIHQWFKNGDHPNDHPDKMKHFADTEIRNSEYREYLLSEGKVVRFWNHPFIPNDWTCICTIELSKHGWIDQGEWGINVCPGNWVETLDDGKYAVLTEEEYKDRFPEDFI